MEAYVDGYKFVYMNGKWVVLHTFFLTKEEIFSGAGTNYARAVERARKIGGTKFNMKEFGGGIAFDNIDDMHNRRIIAMQQ